MDGHDLLAQIRSEGITVPILILTARGDIDERVEGLNKGADDYLSKPFAPDELAARVRALLRRPGSALGVELSTGNICLNTADRNIFIAGEQIILPRREVDLLETLMRRAGRVIPKSAIEDQLYAFGNEVASNSVEVCVHRLRKSMDKAGANVTIHTVRGIGYLLSDEQVT